MKNTGLFVILIFRRKVFEKSTCILLAGLTVDFHSTIGLLLLAKPMVSVLDLNIYTVCERRKPMNQIKIGRFIAECRKKANLTQMQLAKKLGITDKAISKWERGVSQT